MLSLSSMSTTSGGSSYPYNDEGYAMGTSSFCYDTSCKTDWVELFVR